MLTPRLAHRLTGPVTFVSRHLPEVGTKVIQHLHRRAVGHQLLPLMIDNFEIMVDPNDNCGGRLFYYGSYEPEQTKVFKDLLKAMSPCSFIDIGANIGYYSLIAAAHSDAKVYSFEASPKIASVLAQSVARNGFGERVKITTKAVSRESGTLTFFVNENPHNFGLGSTVNSEASSTVLEVVACALDEELTGPLGGSVLCKMDVEGGEYLALQGMTRILTEYHPTMIVEIHPVELRRGGWSATHVFDLLRSHGYTLRLLDQREVERGEDLPEGYNSWIMAT